jgi:hypothetical protein
MISGLIKKLHISFINLDIVFKTVLHKYILLHIQFRLNIFI